MNNEANCRPEPGLETSNSNHGLGTFLVVLGIVLAIYGAWLLAFWPGMLGEDSLAIILEIESNGTFQSRKPVFWYYFVKLLSGPDEWVQIPIAVQMLIASAVFARILSWCLLQKMTKIFIFGLVFICLAPNMIFFAGLLYADGVYSVCVTGLLFELWLVARRGRLTAVSFAVIAITLPFAAFARANGIVFFIVLLPVLFVLQKTDRLKLVAIALAWVALVWLGGHLHKTAKHGALFPLALFETVNFLQPRPMGLWPDSPRLSETTMQVLTQQASVAKIIENYDPDYWDPLVYKEGGPDFLALNRKQRETLVKEFFRYNLWQNIPDFVASRVNVFLVAALGKGGFPSLDDAARIMGKIKTKAEFRAMHANAAESFFRLLFGVSYGLRWLLWTPLFGIALMFLLLRSGWRRKDFPTLLVTVPMALQLGGIFFFSIAGEYRYLLPFFVLPLVLLPVMATQRTRDAAA